MAAVDVQAARPARTAPPVPRRQPAELPEGFWYSVKCRALGLPLVTEQLKNQRLSRPLALGVLSCDGLSSAAYGTEEILRALLPFFGLAAFSLVLPMTLLILFGVVLVVLSYREVVSVYTRAGGSYVVARENFGPRVAQVAAVARPGSAASRGRRPPSSRSTSGTRSRRSTPGGSGRRLTGSRTRRPAPTRSGPCASRAGLPSRVGCTRRRFARAGTTATCWRARSPTRPAS